MVGYLVMLMGYTTTEARRGLRSSQGNVDQAVEFILEVIENKNLKFVRK
jgi:hypothetical protein